MALGAVTSLGVGSGFELQQMLEDLRETDEVTLNIKKNEQTRLNEQVVEFDALNAKILQMKSDALSLSLESNFIEREAVTDETVATASVQHGAAVASYSLDISRLASKSSWQTETGMTDPGAVMLEAPTTSLSTFTEPAVTETTNLSFTIEDETGQKTISLSLAADASIEDIVAGINAHSDNINGETTYVTASAATTDNGSYIRLSSTLTDTTENHKITVSEGPDFITPDLTFSYQVGDDNEPVYVTVPPATSYQSVVSMINDDTNNPGMTAALIDTGIGDTPWHLTFTANASGENNRIVLSEDLAMTEIQGSDGEGSLNASFLIDGYAYQRQNNSGIDDIIQGVSLTLKKIDSTQVSVSASTDTMKENIIHLIDTYNEINADIDLKTQYATDQDEGGVLSNIQALKSLDSILFDLLGTTVETGSSITSLADLGMGTNQNGTITLDQSVLDEVFSSSLDEVIALFIGDSDNDVTGLGDALNDRLRSMTNSSTGIVNAEKSTVQVKIDNLTDSIETATERLDKKYDQMAQQFVQLDAYIGKMNSQANYLASMFESFNNNSSTE